MSVNAQLYVLGCVAKGVAVNLAAVADVEEVLYIVPAGYSFVPFAVLLRSFSAEENATPPIITLGKGGGSCDEFLGNQTLSNITAAYATEVIILQPVPAATPVCVDLIPALSAFSLEITQANGAELTCVADVYGYLF
jgi:hypothetical protein